MNNYVKTEDTRPQKNSEYLKKTVTFRRREEKQAMTTAETIIILNTISKKFADKPYWVTGMQEGRGVITIKALKQDGHNLMDEDDYL
ncbi:MAG: hypothetical protein U0945_12195, partial [Flavobacterium sp.]|nr:hypothetical protein [Flavobacterium sp.]